MQGHIAIVDDDRSIRRAMVRLLAAHSFKARGYASARALIKSLDVATPACVITDLRMDDMTGLELLHHLAGTGLKIPTIVMTAGDEPGLPRRCELAGATLFLTKPVAVDALLNAIIAATAQRDMITDR